MIDYDTIVNWMLQLEQHSFEELNNQPHKRRVVVKTLTALDTLACSYLCTEEELRVEEERQRVLRNSMLKPGNKGSIATWKPMIQGKPYRRSE
jgi:predicted nucleic acid-binding Zn ribbon protein